MSEATLLTLIRHGETPANTGGIWHGSTDTPLSDRGFEQARCAGRYLESLASNFAAIYASPLQRAHNTAREIASCLDLEVHTEHNLTEYDLGSWEGKSYAELHTELQLWDRIKEDPDFAPHGGESPVQVVNRYLAAFEAIVARHPGERVIAVGHAGAFSMAFAQLLEGTYTNWGRVMDNCAISEITLQPKPRLVRFNHVEHLAELD